MRPGRSRLLVFEKKDSTAQFPSAIAWKRKKSTSFKQQFGFPIKTTLNPDFQKI